MRYRLHQNRRGDSGTVLIVTMWVTMVLAGLVLVLSRSVRVDALASANRVAGLQAESIARGALQYVLSEVDGTNGSPDFSTLECDQVPVGSGYFWLLQPDLSDHSNYYYGLRDEASRLNLNTISQAMLQQLPDMTPDLAASIVAWRSPASDVSSGGAEGTYYLMLDPPYNCKNSPFETVEETILVAGATKQIIYGGDANLNGVLDPGEDINGNGTLDTGIFPYLTVYSKEPNTSADGQRRIDVNSANNSQLEQLLTGVVPDAEVRTVRNRIRSRRPFQNVLDFYAKSGLTSQQFGAIADRVTTSTQSVLTGLVDVDTAPPTVLECLPGLEQNDVDALVQARNGANTDLTNIAWVLQALTPQKAAAIGSYITVRSYQFSADIVAVSGDGRAFRRYRAVIDARTSPPNVVYWRDLTSLGWPLDPSILTTLRAGQSLAQVDTTTTSSSISLGASPAFRNP